MTDTTPAPLVPETFIDQKSIRKSVVAGSVGVFVHWFDWAIYAYLASTLSIVFFPDQDRTAGLLAVFGVFAISFGANFSIMPAPRP